MHPIVTSWALEWSAFAATERLETSMDSAEMAVTARAMADAETKAKANTNNNDTHNTKP